MKQPHLLTKRGGALLLKRPLAVSLRAFTLVELLLVMGIIIILAAAMAPAIKGPLDSVNLSGASETVNGMLSAARQAAISRNMPTEVRIYQQGSGTASPYSIMGVVIPNYVIYSGTVVDEWIIPAKPIAGNVIFSTGTSSYGDAFSSIISKASYVAPTKSSPNPVNTVAPGTNTSAPPIGPWSATELTAPNAPGMVAGLPYVGFRFEPDGSTNLGVTSSGSNSWCLSIIGQSAKANTNAGVPGTNFVTIVLDPLTGRAMTYRP